MTWRSKTVWFCFYTSLLLWLAILTPSFTHLETSNGNMLCVVHVQFYHICEGHLQKWSLIIDLMDLSTDIRRNILLVYHKESAHMTVRTAQSQALQVAVRRPRELA